MEQPAQALDLLPEKEARLDLRAWNDGQPLVDTELSYYLWTNFALSNGRITTDSEGRFVLTLTAPHAEYYSRPSSWFELQLQANISGDWGATSRDVFGATYTEFIEDQLLELDLDEEKLRKGERTGFELRYGNNTTFANRQVQVLFLPETDAPTGNLTGSEFHHLREGTGWRTNWSLYPRPLFPGGIQMKMEDDFWRSPWFSHRYTDNSSVHRDWLLVPEVLPDGRYTIMAVVLDDFPYDGENHRYRAWQVQIEVDEVEDGNNGLLDELFDLPEPLEPLDDELTSSIPVLSTPLMLIVLFVVLFVLIKRRKG
jgi:hypothetical protein